MCVCVCVCVCVCMCVCTCVCVCVCVCVMCVCVCVCVMCDVCVCVCVRSVVHACCVCDGWGGVMWDSVSGASGERNAVVLSSQQSEMWSISLHGNSPRNALHVTPPAAHRVESNTCSQQGVV